MDLPANPNLNLFVLIDQIGKLVHQTGKLFDQSVGGCLGRFIHRYHTDTLSLQNNEGNRGQGNTATDATALNILQLRLI